jgi:hypothetical protein
MKLEFFSTAVRKILKKIPDFMKIRAVGAELFHVDRRMNRRTDRQI